MKRFKHFFFKLGVLFLVQVEILNQQFTKFYATFAMLADEKLPNTRCVVLPKYHTAFGPAGLAWLPSNVVFFSKQDQNKAHLSFWYYE